MKKTSKMVEIEKKIEEPIEEFLRREYVDNKMSLHEIARSLGIGAQTTLEWVRKADIPTRSLSEAQTSIQSRKHRPSKEELYQMYIVDELTAIDIGKKFGVNKSASARWVREAGLKNLRPLREKKSETRKITQSRTDYEGYDIKIGKRQFKKPSKSQLGKWYLKELKSSYEIAEIVGVHPSSILNWMREYRVPVRDDAQSKFALKDRLVEEPSKEELNRLYNVEKKTTYDIADIYGVSDTTAGRWLEKAGIKRRDVRDATFLSLGKEQIKKPSQSELGRLYLEGEKSTHSIAKEFGVEQITVWRWLNEYGILKRSLMDSQFAHHGKEVEKPSDDELHRLYVKEEKSLYEIAESLGANFTTVAGWLEKAEIERRETAFGYKDSLGCDDGHLVKSTLERSVDNWLYENGIPHEYDKKLPGSTFYKYDFKVGDTYIEIWGLLGVEFYEDKMEEKKIPYYEKHKLKRIDLFPEDFDSKNSFVKKLRPLLKYSEPQLRRQRQIKDY